MKTVTVDPEIMWGAPVFAGTKVPVQTLLDYIETGETVDTFLSEFPSVSREMIVSFLEQGAERLIAPEREAVSSL
ncbi:MAG: DUF433 domain-containing protein [Fimbriimonas sp.]|nr:DUF433 domain-containing protein [Fimbriimonas sp.]